MKKIRIVATPPGQAPEEVRMAWVGVVMPIIEEDFPGVQVGALGGAPQNLGGYRVFGGDALSALAKKDKRAFMWWMKNQPLAAVHTLVFAREVCEEI